MSTTPCNNCPQAPVNWPCPDFVPAEHIYTSMTKEKNYFSKTYTSEEELKKILQASLKNLDAETEELFDIREDDIPDPVVFLCTVEEIPATKLAELFMSNLKEDLEDVKEDIPSYELYEVHSLIDRVLDGVQDTIETSYLQGFDDEAELDFSKELYNKLAEDIIKGNTDSAEEFAKSLSIWPSSIATPYCKFNAETGEILPL